MNTRGRKKILVTGGAGYIGSHTVLALFKQGFEIFIYDNLYNSSASTVDRLNRYLSGDIQLIRGDILCRDTLDTTFKSHRFDAVVHFAALKAVAESSLIPLAYYQTNVSGTLNLLDVMQAHGVNNFIFSSSATVYGKDNPVPFNEEMTLGDPESPYGQTKRVSEDILKALAHSDPQFKAISLRYFNPIGAHEYGIIGESPKGIPNNLLPYLTQVANGYRDVLTIFGDDYDTPDGTCIRDFVHVMDIAEGHVAALHWLFENNISGSVQVFNLGTGQGLSIKEIINAFEKITGINIPCKVGSRRTGDLPAFWADATKAREVIGWSAKRSIANMVSDAWNWQMLTEETSELDADTP